MRQTDTETDANMTHTFKQANWFTENVRDRPNDMNSNKNVCYIVGERQKRGIQIVRHREKVTETKTEIERKNN